jgi:hypothetical protein
VYCQAKTRLGGICQKHGMANGRCRLHGGFSPKGKDHWNWQHGRFTKEQRRYNVQMSNELKELELLMTQLGML